MKTTVNHQFKPGQFVVLKHLAHGARTLCFRIRQVNFSVGLTETLVRYDARPFGEDGWAGPCVQLVETEIEKAITKPPEGWRKSVLIHEWAGINRPRKAAKKKGK